MNNHTRLLVAGAALAALVLAAVLSAPQLTVAGDKDPARALLEKSVEAVGGKKKCASWETMVEKGELTVHWEGWGSPRAVATRFVKKPDKMVLDQDFSAHDHPFFFTYYYNAGDVWAVINLGVRENARYTKFMTRSLKNTHGVYYFLTECDTFFVVPDVPDDSLVTGADVNRVGIVDNGDTIMVDLDKKTFLPLRQVEDGGSQHTIFQAWHHVQGLKRPYRVTVYQNGAVSAEYIWEEIKFDVPLADGLFEEQRPAKESSG
jgi:hypothetical protein